MICHLKNLCDLSLADQAAAIRQIRNARGKHVANYIANRVLARTFGDDAKLAEKRKTHTRLQAIRYASETRRQANQLLWGHV
jgi:hypothetical protein